jgi:hypothetical protein
MHDLKVIWTALAEQHGIHRSDNEGSTIIMDNTFPYAKSKLLFYSDVSALLPGSTT